MFEKKYPNCIYTPCASFVTKIAFLLHYRDLILAVYGLILTLLRLKATVKGKWKKSALYDEEEDKKLFSKHM